VTPQQLPLDLGHRPALGREDFLVAASNAEAVGWIDRYPAWPSHALALVGPAGCGKTHLAHVFAGRTGAAVAPLAAATAESVVPGGVYIGEHGEAPLDERQLFHALNAIKEQGGHLLLTGREAPARWPVRLRDLGSRLAALPVVRIAAPDDGLLEAVIIKLFADRQIEVAPDVVAYLLRHMDRSFAAVRDLVARADAASLAGRRAVTIPLVRELLQQA
jgi:chromosomal replication initiation ATPase DnaA